MFDWHCCATAFSHISLRFGFCDFDGQSVLHSASLDFICDDFFFLSFSQFIRRLKLVFFFCYSLVILFAGACVWTSPETCERWTRSQNHVKYAKISDVQRFSLECGWNEQRWLRIITINEFCIKCAMLLRICEWIFFFSLFHFLMNIFVVLFVLSWPRA